MLNFNNRIQAGERASFATATSRAVVFHALVKGRVRAIRVTYEAAAAESSTNYVELEFKRRRGTDEIDVGDGISNAATAYAQFQMVDVHNLASAEMVLEPGDSIILNGDVNGTGAVKVHVAIDFEVIGNSIIS